LPSWLNGERFRRVVVPWSFVGGVRRGETVK